MKYTEPTGTTAAMHTAFAGSLGAARREADATHRSPVVRVGRHADAGRVSHAGGRAGEATGTGRVSTTPKKREQPLTLCHGLLHFGVWTSPSTQ